MAQELNNKSIGNRIKEARVAVHLTQEILAERTGLSLTHMCAIENGYSGASLPAIARIAECLDVSLDWLVLGTMHHNPELPEVLREYSKREQQILVDVLKIIKKAGNHE